MYRLPYPFALVDTRLPDYYHGLAKEKEDFAIIEMPIKHGIIMRGQNFYYHAVHKKKNIYKLSGFGDTALENNAFFKYLEYISSPLQTPEFADYSMLKQGLNALRSQRFKYIIVLCVKSQVKSIFKNMGH